LALKNVGPTWNPDGGEKDDAGKPKGEQVIPREGKIPRLTHMLFQGMFFIITPALICGAFAERMKFSTMVVFMLLWDTLVYCPLCHWVWDTGLLAFSADGNPNALAGGALDFAGGTVVHISSGVSALVCALVMGKRLGYGSEPMPPHNLTYTTIGAALLWVGWLASTPAASWPATASRRWRSRPPTCRRRPVHCPGPAPNGCFRGKPTILGACSGAVPVWSA